MEILEKLPPSFKKDGIVTAGNASGIVDGAAAVVVTREKTAKDRGLKAMGRIGLKAMVYFEVATTIALFLGLALVNIFKPGAGLAIPIGADTTAAAAMAQNQQHAWDIFLHLFPTSVVDAMARGDMLQLVVFSLFFGIALAAIGSKGQPVVDVLDATAQAP